MKNLFKYIIVLVLFTTNTYAQQNNTLYMLNNVPQRNILNPAINHTCKMNFSGLFIPITGQIMPPIHFNYNNNAFALKNILYPGKGIYKDSLITPFQKGENHNKFLQKTLKKVNYINVETHIDLFTAGYVWKDFFFTFHVTEKIESRFSFPRDLIVLAWEGNGKSFIDNEAFLSYLGFSGVHYREFAAGGSKVINDKLTVGAKAKLLFGKSNIHSKKTHLTLNTASTDFASTINTDMAIYSSQHFFNIHEFYYDFENDSVVYKDTVFENVSVKDILFEKRNPGLGFDLGAVYKYDDKITLYASILDLGFIRWRNNVNSFHIKGEFTWDGWSDFDFKPDDVGDSLANETGNQFRDSLIRLFNPQHKNDAYTMMLTPKFYLGGTYQVHEKLNLGLLFRGDFFQHRLHGGVTLSANSDITKWFGASLSYSIQNNSFNNFGAGLVFKAPFFQFYVVTDNYISNIWPQATRNINFRMGINLMFGCNKRQSEAMLR